MTPIACAVLTLSDTRTPETDRSGQLIQTLVLAQGHQILAYAVVNDEPALLEDFLARWCGTVAVLLINGGTGISPRDITPDVLHRHFDQTLPGFGELFRLLSWEQIGSKALASRACAGVIRGTIVFALPGSTKAVALGMERLILPELPHLVGLLRGQGHDNA